MEMSAVVAMRSWDGSANLLYRHRMMACAGLILLLASVAMASEHPATLQVSVVDETNQPIASATISVTLGEKPIITAATDARGMASFEVPSAGTYLVDIRKKGYLTTDTTVEVATDREVPPVDVVLSTVD